MLDRLSFSIPFSKQCKLAVEAAQRAANQSRCEKEQMANQINALDRELVQCRERTRTERCKAEAAAERNKESDQVRVRGVGATPSVRTLTLTVSKGGDWLPVSRLKHIDTR